MNTQNKEQIILNRETNKEFKTSSLNLDVSIETTEEDLHYVTILANSCSIVSYCIVKVQAFISEFVFTVRFKIFSTNT